MLGSGRIQPTQERLLPAVVRLLGAVAAQAAGDLAKASEIHKGLEYSPNPVD